MSSKFLDTTGLNTLWAKIKSTFQTLGNLVTAWGSTPSDTKYPSEKLVKTALDGKAASSHTHGNIQNDGKIGTTADYAVVTTTGGAVTATSLATSSPSTSGNTLEFIDTVSQNSKGKISATKKKVTIDSTLSSTSTNPVQNKAVQEAIATHTHTLLSAEPLANAQLPNNSEQTYFKRFYGYVTSYLAAVKLYDVTEFYDGTIVNNYAEHSAFVGDVSFIRTSGISLVSKSKVCMTQGYYSSGARLYGDSARCHPIVLKDSRNVLSSWISGSYIPTGNIGSTVNMTPTTNSNMAHCVIDCASYSTLYVNLSSMTGAPAWTFIDSTNKVIAKASSIAANATLDVPQGAAKIICAIKNAADNKQYSYVAAESATPRYYLALRTDISMGSYMVCEGSFFTRTTATSTISARPLITENFAIINIGGASTALPAGYSVHEDTSYTDVAGTLGTARKLAVSLSNTSTDTTFNGSADVTNIKTTGTLGIGNGGTGATTAIGAEYNILNQVADIDTTIDGNRKIALCNQSKSASNGVFRWLKLSNVWTWIKGLLSSESGVNISGNAATATTATNYNTSSGNIKTALDGKSSTSHTHSVSINGSTKTIAASGETAVDLGTYKVFKYARVYATHAYNANTNRYILLAFKSTTYTNNWEESSMFKLVVHDGQFPKEFVFRLWLNGTMSTGVVPADPSDPKLYRVYSENFSESALNILDVRLFVVGKSASSITFTIGIFIDRYYLQARWVSYQLYPLSYGARDRGDTIDNGLSSWTYTVGQDVYSDLYNLFTTAFEVNDLTLDMNVTKARFASNGIFYATYGITTFIEMKVALMEGNVVILRHNGQSILCQSWSDTEIYFAGVTCPEEREPPTLLRFWCYVNTGWSTYPSSYGVCVPVANTVMKTVYMSETVAEWMQIGNLLIGGNGVNGGGIDIRARAVNSSFDCKMDEVIYTNAPGINNGSCVFADRSFSLSSWGLLFQVSQTIGAGQYPAKFTVNLYTKDAIPEHYRIEFHFVSENNYQKVYISAECSRGTEFDDG